MSKRKRLNVNDNDGKEFPCSKEVQVSLPRHPPTSSRKNIELADQYRIKGDYKEARRLYELEMDQLDQDNEAWLAYIYLFYFQEATSLIQAVLLSQKGVKAKQSGLLL